MCLTINELLPKAAKTGGMDMMTPGRNPDNIKKLCNFRGMAVWVFVMAMCFFSLWLKADSLKEYIYMDGKAVAVETSVVSSVGDDGCTYSISPTSKAFTRAAGSGTISVTSGSGCVWSAKSNAFWVSITGGSTGAGPGVGQSEFV